MKLNLTKWEQAQKKLIMQALHHSEGNPEHAAAFLGIGRTTLYNKLSIYYLWDFVRKNRKKMRKAA